MGFAKVFHFILFRHLGPHGTFMTFVGEPKFSISSSFSSTWRYTEFYMPELCSMCKMVTLSVRKSVCPCVMWGVIRRDTGNIHVMGVFIRVWGHYLLRNTQVIQVPMLWPSVLRDVVFLQVPGVGTACFIQVFARLSSTTSVSWLWS